MYMKKQEIKTFEDNLMRVGGILTLAYMGVGAEMHALLYDGSYIAGPLIMLVTLAVAYVMFQLTWGKEDSEDANNS